MRIRRLSRGDDLSAATALLVRFFREEGFDTPDEAIAANTERMAGLDICLILLAERDGQAVGVATVSTDFGIEYGWSAEIGDLYVHPDHRGRSISRELILAAEAWMRDRGVSTYFVTVTPFSEEHHGLRRFYAGLGFVDEGRSILAKAL